MAKTSVSIKSAGNWARPSFHDKNSTLPTWALITAVLGGGVIHLIVEASIICVVMNVDKHRLSR